MIHFFFIILDKNLREKYQNYLYSYSDNGDPIYHVFVESPIEYGDFICGRYRSTIWCAYWDHSDLEYDMRYSKFYAQLRDEFPEYFI